MVVKQMEIHPSGDYIPLMTKPVFSHYPEAWQFPKASFWLAPSMAGKFRCFVKQGQVP